MKDEWESGKKDEWETPPDLFNVLNRRFAFVLDPCTTADNPLQTQKFFTKETDGLAQSWHGPVFMNPPYSQAATWASKAARESEDGTLVVGLVRCDPSTKWWQEWVRDKQSLVYPLHRRVKFVGAPSAYPFPSAIVIWHGLYTW